MENLMDLEKAKKKPMIWTAFAYDKDPADLHCTHKFIGDMSETRTKLVEKIIDKYFDEKSFESFSPKFDKEKFFGENEDVRVLATSAPKENFYLDLRELLDPFRKDDFDYNPHVTCDQDEIEEPFTRYVLMKGDDIVREWKV